MTVIFDFEITREQKQNVQFGLKLKKNIYWLITTPKT